MLLEHYTGDLVAESINFDYLAGQPESHKTLYVTLRQPPTTIRRGDTVKLKYLPSRNNTAFGTTNSTMYHVGDIHGRSLVVEPINGGFVSTHYPNYVSSRSGNREGIYTYKPRPYPQHVNRDVYSVYKY